MAKLINCECC